VRSKLALSLSFMFSLAIPISFVVALAWGTPSSSGLPACHSPHGAVVFLVGSVLGAAWLGHYFALALALGCHNNEAGSAARIDQFCTCERGMMASHRRRLRV
jgi:hypothetical protein